MKNKKYIFIYLTVIINLFLLFFYIYRNFNNLKNFNYDTLKFNWFFTVFLIILTHYLLNALIFKIFISLYNSHYHFYQGFMVFLISSFYSKMIPLGNSDQIMQIYVLKKQNIRMNNAVSLSIMNFILKKIIIFLVVIVSVIFKFNSLVRNNNSFTFLVIIIGFCINILVMLCIFLMIFSFKIKKMSLI